MAARITRTLCVKMIAVEEPELVHEIEYRSSGSSSPRDLTLQISVVRYTSSGDFAPTFLATADLQGREKHPSNRLLGELVADEIIALQELDVLPAFDFCALCGDFYGYPDLRKLGGTGNVTPALNALSKTASLTFAVLGNHDEIEPDELNSDITILDGTSSTTASCTIAGVSGIVGNPKRNNRKTETEFLAAIERCSTSRTDVLLLHQGPKGPTEAECGFDAINELLRKRSQLLVVFGHCHWLVPFYPEGRNLFCNVDARVLAFIPTEEDT